MSLPFAEISPLSLIVRDERSGPVSGRHPWVFSKAILSLPNGLIPGTPIRLASQKGKFLGFGYFSSYSQIAVRMWGYDEHEKIDADFFRKRISRALSLRKNYVETEGTDSYRLINSENDFLPGLVVDRYGKWLVIQFHTIGIEAWKIQIIESLISVLDPKGIFERSEVGSRRAEGSKGSSGLIYGDIPDLITIMENGFRFFVNLKEGQKTGFFLDQRDKRFALMKYTGSKSVLNCFSYTGGFTVYALASGASRVTSVDVSSSALSLAKENVKLNGFNPDICEFICQDSRQFLRETRPNHYGVVVVDPPAFIKDRRKKKEGLVGYKSLNELAIRILPEDGILLTCSCSAHLTQDEFRFLLSEAGGKTARTLQILETLGHGADHPELVPFSEGKYLKCFIIKT